MVDYINNKEFEKLIQSYISGDKSIENELFTHIGLLVDKLITGYSFKLDREEAKQDCLLLILKVLKRFNKEYGKGFNFLTTVILNNLRLLYVKNKKYNQKIENYIEFKTSGLKPYIEEDD